MRPEEIKLAVDQFSAVATRRHYELEIKYELTPGAFDLGTREAKFEFDHEYKIFMRCVKPAVVAVDAAVYDVAGAISALAEGLEIGIAEEAMDVLSEHYDDPHARVVLCDSIQSIWRGWLAIRLGTRLASA